MCGHCNNAQHVFDFSIILYIYMLTNDAYIYIYIYTRVRAFACVCTCCCYYYFLFKKGCTCKCTAAEVQWLSRVSIPCRHVEAGRTPRARDYFLVQREQRRHCVVKGAAVCA